MKPLDLQFMPHLHLQVATILPGLLDRAIRSGGGHLCHCYSFSSVYGAQHIWEFVVLVIYFPSQEQETNEINICNRCLMFLDKVTKRTCTSSISALCIFQREENMPPESPYRASVLIGDVCHSFDKHASKNVSGRNSFPCTLMKPSRVEQVIKMRLFLSQSFSWGPKAENNGC